MYDEELLERGLHPRFRGEIPGVEPIKLLNASCGDEILVYLKVSDGKILDGKWNGNGCAISLASADFFIESVVGKSLDEAKMFTREFSKMILSEKYDEKKIGAAKAMKCVSRMPARAKCAKLALKSLDMI
ncbi:SUF system NifU family Fe-S cluster assembly protein [Candidatus Saccharibacteria bacterium]|nr:SUF system NifU family Fe-S cluster assembly protein [Candidatus Saccharibacteria bacterium]